MTEKYCTLPPSICSFGTGEKADCENCELNRRFSKRTIDNWESYIVDNKTGKEYGTDINRLLDLLNEQEAEIKKLKEMGQEVYELDSKRSLYILQVMQKFARQYSQDSKEYDLLYKLGKELPINPNNLWPKESFTEEELIEDD